MSSDNSLIDAGEDLQGLHSDEESSSQDPQNNEQKERLKKEATEFIAKQKKRGVCYLSRVPPFMTVSGLRRYFKKFKETMEK